MKTLLWAIATLAAIAALSTGCQTETGALPPENAARFNRENTATFVVLDPGAEKSVGCAALQERRLDDGRLEVLAQVRNRENRRLQVQVNCIFQDARGISTADETPFQTLSLTENSTEEVRFVSMNNRAQRYTIRVRAAR